MGNLSRKICSFLFANKLFLAGFLLSVSIVSYFTSSNLINPFSYSSKHQAINAWKIYEIDKNHLNPLHYDLELPDLAGGRFISYWDPPFPYIFAFLLSKTLFSFGEDRYIVAVKSLTFINFLLTFTLFYLTLRLLGVGRLLSSFTPVLLQSHKAVLDSLLSLNMPGIWALILPIYAFLNLRKNQNLKSHAFLGLSLSVAALQNPYYGAFSAVFLTLPFFLALLKTSRSSLKKGAFSFLAFGALLIIPIILLKGYDFYLIRTRRLEDPQKRNYITMQAQSYRFWHHFMPRSGSVFEGYINPPIKKLLGWASGYVDELTIWRPDSNNPAYLGIANIAIFSFLFLLLIRRIGFFSFIRSISAYLLSFILGALIFFRGDMFLFGNHHIVFPWYRLQAVSPLTTPGYYANLAILLFFLSIAVLLASVRSKAIVIGCLVLMFVFLPDIAGGRSGTCSPFKDIELHNYLNSAEKRRVFIYLARGCDTEIDPWSLSNAGYYDKPLSRDGRFYQIYYKTPIYAKGSLSWFDNYQYDESTLKYRTLESILTDENDDFFRKEGVEEIVFLVDGIRGKDYWEYFDDYYRRKTLPKLFETAAVLSLE